MINKIKRFSFSQLLLLRYFLANSEKILTYKEIAKHTQLEGKSLGGVISSLARTVNEGVRLIEPLGRAVDGPGLRWRINTKGIDIEETKKEVRKLLMTYE